MADLVRLSSLGSSGRGLGLSPSDGLIGTTLPPSPSSPSPITIKSSHTIWHRHELFRVKVSSAIHLQCKDMGTLYVRVGLYHGLFPLCNPKEIDTKEVLITTPKWHEWITFNITTIDLPLGARLCIALYCVSKQHKKVSLALSLIFCT